MKLEIGTVSRETPERGLKNVDYRAVIERMKQNEEIRKVFYFLMEKNPSGGLPYHGNVHSLSVAIILNEVFKDDEVLCVAATIAGLCHDFGHAGVGDSKAPNIETAISMTERVWPEKDRQIIQAAIEATYFPYKMPPESMDLTNKIGVLQMAIRLADLSWQNIFPIDVAEIGIHQEQFSGTAFEKVEDGTKKFSLDTKELYKNVENSLPKELQPLYTLFLSR